MFTYRRGCNWFLCGSWRRPACGSRRWPFRSGRCRSLRCGRQYFIFWWIRWCCWRFSPFRLYDIRDRLRNRVNIQIKNYPRSCSSSWLRDNIIYHVVIKNFHQSIFRSANTSEVVHINSPSHCPSISFMLDEVHFDLNRFRILVADPLVTLVHIRAITVIVPFNSPTTVLLNFVTDFVIRHEAGSVCIRPWRSSVSFFIDICTQIVVGITVT